MTAETTEVKAETTLSQDKVDKVSQEKIDLKKTSSTPESSGETEQQEDPNWRAFREARKKDRIEKEAAEKRAYEKEAEANALKAAMEAAFSKSGMNQSGGMSQQYSGYNEEGETEDERIEKKVQAALAAREASYERERAQREQQEYPQRLQQTYPDFNSIVSTDNLDYLEYHYPEITGPLKRLPDDYHKWADIYRAVKKFVPNSSTAKKESAKADANFAKPKSMSSTGITQSGEAMSNARLTDEKRAANWERMQRTLKGLT